MVKELKNGRLTGAELGTNILMEVWQVADKVRTSQEDRQEASKGSLSGDRC